MQTSNTLKQLLTRHLAAQQPDIILPPAQKLEAARQLILKRKPSEAQRPDIVSFVAGFLNMKIKLYHAVIASVIIAAGVLYFSNSNNNPKPVKQTLSAHYNSGIAAVNNSTVLSSIHTFVIPGK